MPTQQTYLRDVDVAARYGISRQTVWHWAKQGRIPMPVKLTPGCTRWNRATLEAWEQKKEAAA